MSATEKATAVQPVRGPLFEAVARRDVGGAKRKKVLALIAAFRDAGHDPTVAELAERSRSAPVVVVKLAERLEQDGHLLVTREEHGRARYEIPTAPETER